MLSDSVKVKTTYKNPKDKSILAKTRGHWSDKQKLEAVQSYLLLGNLSLTGRILGIPEVTLRVWKTTDWWNDLVNEVKTQERIQLSARMKQIVDASLTVVEDRLLNGDYQFDQKTGQTIRKPVNMKDAHKVAVDLQDRQEILEKSEKPVITDDHIEDKLLKLAAKFAEMATKSIQDKKDEQRTVDAEIIEVNQ